MVSYLFEYEPIEHIKFNSFQKQKLISYCMFSSNFGCEKLENVGLNSISVQIV